MKRILLCDRRPVLLETIEVLLRHWGYRVLVVNRPEQITELVSELVFDLVLISVDFLKNFEEVDSLLKSKGVPVITMGATDERLTSNRHLTIPLDVFSLFSLTQQHLEKIPRRHLRLPVKVPALLERDGKEQLCEIVSLSRHGLFVKSSLLMNKGEFLCMILPLIGLKRELDLKGRVLYVIRPAMENNYLNGFGVEFVEPTTESLLSLERFIEQRLMADLADYGHTLPTDPPLTNPLDTSPKLLKLLSLNT